MKKIIYNFLLMIQLFTRVPINKALPCEDDNFRNGANFFALVGLLIGLCQYILFILLNKLLPTSFAVISIIIFDILFTGALHIDGFADTCDGFFAFKGKDKNKIIEIMKDSRIGTFGCIGIIINILIKYEAYLVLVDNFNILIIAIIPMISKFSMVLLSYIGKPAKEKGSGNLFINTVTLKELIINIIFVLGSSFLFDLVLETVVLSIAAAITTILFNWLCNFKIGGVTGDSLGANNELVVLLGLIIITVLS